MKYDPRIHHRRSIRLKGYDYSQAGLYFVTICIKNRLCLLGHITNQKMLLNDAGNMIVKWYYELENKFPDILCHEMITMPNHFHCILQNTGLPPPAVRADLRVCPTPNSPNPKNHPPANPLLDNKHASDEHASDKPALNKHASDEHVSDEHASGEHTSDEHIGSPLLGEHMGSPLHRVVQWFKTMTTNEYIRGVKNHDWERFDGKLWQRNYYEHIIRDDRAYRNISNYIRNNPAKWQQDKLR